ncbi:hypothetical protein P5V15_003180 [Pogonomyrmex californicus]
MADPLEKLTVVREKNFVKQNILCVKRSYPAKPKRRFVDTRYGDMHDLKSSGLYPVYIHKKNYGKIPRFIAINAKSRRMETEMTVQRDVLNGDKISKLPACRYIDKKERKMLLDGMKQKWEEAMKLFQGLPFLTDTPPKAQRKAEMERELQQLEKDITIIEQHPHIYVYDDTTQ